MEKTLKYSNKDPFLLQCCLMSRREPYVGVEKNCDKNALFCIEHNCHMNEQGLMHEMIPLRDFKRKIDERRFQMQSKIRSMVDVFEKFIDKLIQNLRQLKLRKTLQLSMLWLRDLAASEEQYELMKRIYRLDFEDISCKDVKSIYYKIIHNKQLYEKQIGQLNCYKGIYQTLNQLNENQKMNALLSEKLAQIEGVLTNGEIMKKLLPDRRILNENLKEVLLEQDKDSQNYKISYNKAQYQKNTTNYRSVSSKYPILSHLTYHIYIKTKYSNVMVGICNQKLKQLINENDIHYNEGAISFNCANGNTYKQGMFISGSNHPIKDINELNLKLRLTNNELFLFTNKCLLMRCSINNLSGALYLFFSARTEGDLFEVHCDNDISSDNIKVLQFIKEEMNKKQQNEISQNKQKVDEGAEKNRQQLFKSFNNNIKLSNQSSQPQIYRQNTFGDRLPSKNIRNEITEKTQVKEQINEVFGQQENLNFSKIKQCFKNIRINIKKTEMQEEKQMQEGSIKWSDEKNKYLSDIKEKVNKLRQKNNNPNTYNQLKKSNQIQKQMQKKTMQKKMMQKQIERLSNQLIPKTKTESSARQVSKININPSEVSNIKINLSDQISDLYSGAKNSLLSGLRKQSDNINIDEIMKMNAFSQMTESMEPRFPNNKEFKQTIDKIKTPPKMFALSNRFQTNQQFDF